MAKAKNLSHWDPNDPAEVARDKLRKAVKSGRVEKPGACELCDSTGPIIGHHWRGYDWPLDVWWVCVGCNTVLVVHDGTQSKEAARQYVRGKRPMAKKTDNGHLAAKLDLRRHFLHKYHADEPPRVMDCCAGSSRLWTQLRREFAIESYWPLDLKPAKGRLKVDSSRVLAQRGWTENVIDVDSYGSPWKHWEAMLPNITQPTTVFLTLGQLTTGTVGSLGKLPLEYMGLGRFASTLPAGFHVKLRGLVLRYCLARAPAAGVTVVEAMEAVADGNARYIGVRLEVAAKMA